MTDRVKREGWGYIILLIVLCPSQKLALSIRSLQPLSFSSERTKACGYASTGFLIEELFFCQLTEFSKQGNSN